MNQTLHDLGRILLNAVPTFLIVVFLILYLRSVFFLFLIRSPASCSAVMTKPKVPAKPPKRA